MGGEMHCLPWIHRMFFHTYSNGSEMAGCVSFVEMLKGFWRRRVLGWQNCQLCLRKSSQPIWWIIRKRTTILQLSKSLSQVPIKQSTIKNQGLQSYRIHKISEVFREDFSSLWVITRLFPFNDWKDIAKKLEEHSHSKFASIHYLRIKL